MFALTQFDPNSPRLTAEKSEIIKLLDSAYGFSVIPAKLDRFLACEPHGWMQVHDSHGRLVGVGGTISYPDAGFGWIGLIATHPEYERQGIGRMVTEACIDHLRSQGCAAVLDASADGAPLYRRMGFVDVGQSALFVHDGLTFPEVPSTVTSLTNPTAQDEASICSFDAPRFGADRSRLLKHLLVEFPGRVFVSRSPSGELDGFAVGQDNTIGPMVAETPTVLSGLLAATLSVPFAGPVRLPLDADADPRSADPLRAAGFSLLRKLARQQLGLSKLPGQRHLLCAQTSFGEG
jgi:GNAT superfamily N-acetyltransferase